jgi:hypothetical protein
MGGIIFLRIRIMRLVVFLISIKNKIPGNVIKGSGG